MPVQSVELLLDAKSSERVRSEWVALADAGLPALRVDNTPHITVGVAREIWPRIDRAIERLAFSPVDLRIGALAVFTRPNNSTAVLVRQVTPSIELLELHREIIRELASAEGLAGHTRSGDWTPHITLARRFPLERMADAAEALRGAPEFPATVVAIRRWDGVNRKSWLVSRMPDESDSD